MSPRIRNLLLTSTALLSLGSIPGAAGPDGGVVVGGSATIRGQGTSSVIVNQSSQRAIVNWHTFNIGTGESTRFNQPNSSSITLNRVTGGMGPSTINGMLSANGRVFVINRDGMLFGRDARINTAGFVASTSDIKNSDFMAGRYNFNRPGPPRRLDRQSRQHHRVEPRLRRAGGAGRAQFRHHHRDARHRERSPPATPSRSTCMATS